MNGIPDSALAYGFLTLLVFAFGACIGSFLNVCIHRIPRELSIVRPRSRCPRCETPIRWRDNIPLFSFVRLRARCRSCGAPISPRYVTVELLTGLLFLLVWLQFPAPAAPSVLGLVPVANGWLVPIYWLGIGGLILGTFVDFEHMIIPDRVSIGGTAAGLALSALVPAMHGQATALDGATMAAFGAAVGAGILWSIAGLGSFLFRKEAMGFGDVKLMAAIGAFLGWKAVLFTLVISSLFGASAGLILVALGRTEMRGRIPYGPYLALAAVLWVFWGPRLWGAYANLFAVAPPLPM